MGTVSDIIECPKCKDVAELTVEYRKGDEYLFCPNCGYHHSNEGGLITSGGGFGAHVVRYKSHSRIGAFAHPKPARRRFSRAFLSKPRVLAVTITQRVRGKWQQVELKTDPLEAVRRWKDTMRWRYRPRIVFNLPLSDDIPW